MTTERMSAPRRPTLRDVAALAGVSVKTASRVINDEPLVSVDVTTRVLEAVERLSYRPDHRAGSLRRTGRKSETIGVVVSSVANPFAAAVNRAIENAASDRGVAVVATSTDDMPERERSTVEVLLRRRVDGVILTPTRRDQAYLQSEQRYGTPFIAIDREPVGLDADAVVSDHAHGAEVATAHLLERGHRRIAYLGDLGMIQSARERLRGFREALGAQGVPSGICPVVMELHDDEAAERATTQLLRSENPPTAIFSSQNLLTVGAIRALRAAGLHREIALVGFDDLPLADLLEPGITVVAQDPRRIGSLAADLLFARLDGARAEPSTHVVPTRLIERGSGEIPGSPS
jgi:LacI family transcriptional regulator